MNAAHTMAREPKSASPGLLDQGPSMISVRTTLRAPVPATNSSGTSTTVEK